MDNKPSFEQRISALKSAAESLRSAAEVVMTEVIHMEAAQTRFAARKPFRTKQTASR
jgi:hypothetical protein